MEIRWYGHCTFLLKDSLGRRIILDPYNLKFTSEIIKLEPEITILSHEHLNDISLFLNKHNIFYINSICKYNSKFIQIKSYKTYHDNCNGEKRGVNYIYHINFDNLNLCHLGHLGHLPWDNLLSLFKDIDILFIPIGGQFTIDTRTALKIIERINPKIIIPMEYRTKNSLCYLDSPKKLLKNKYNIIVPKSNTFNTNEYKSEKNNSILLLQQSKIKKESLIS